MGKIYSYFSYPSNYEVDVLYFLKQASKKNYKIALPVIGPSNNMKFKPLFINIFLINN